MLETKVFKMHFCMRRISSALVQWVLFFSFSIFHILEDWFLSLFMFPDLSWFIWSLWYPSISNKIEQCMLMTLHWFVYGHSIRFCSTAFCITYISSILDSFATYQGITSWYENTHQYTDYCPFKRAGKLWWTYRLKGKWPPEFMIASRSIKWRNNVNYEIW